MVFAPVREVHASPNTGEEVRIIEPTADGDYPIPLAKTGSADSGRRRRFALEDGPRRRVRAKTSESSTEPPGSSAAAGSIDAGPRDNMAQPDGEDEESTPLDHGMTIDEA